MINSSLFKRDSQFLSLSYTHTNTQKVKQVKDFTKIFHKNINYFDFLFSFSEDLKRTHHFPVLDFTVTSEPLILIRGSEVTLKSSPEYYESYNNTRTTDGKYRATFTNISFIAKFQDREHMIVS